MTSFRLTSSQQKTGWYTLEAINSFAGTYFNYYLFFYMEKQHGFGNLGNLVLSAVIGLVYMIMSWYAGRFAHTKGCVNSLLLGFTGLALTLAGGLLLHSVVGLYLLTLVWTFFLSFTWPALEALVTENEPPEKVPHWVGLYNLGWAGGAAVAFFAGGALLENLGWASLFWLPALLHGLQVLITFGLRRWGPAPTPHAASATHESTAPERDHVTPATARTFLKMAWLTNPFAYIAINTALPLFPDLARKFALSPTWVGIFCSIWMFARVGTFVLLWQWEGWHYRFRWLLTAYLLLIATFALLLLAPWLWLVVVAQVVFGWAVGLIYYSSLYYSMDTTDTKGLQGGVHEAAIGLGICAGPALGAVALWLAPQTANVSAWAVSGLLVAGLGGLGWLQRRRGGVPRN